jgi:hypothetical protein
MTNYVNLDIKDMNETEREIVNAVIHEGEMRQNEKVVELLERKITEAYGNDDMAMIDFLEALIVEIENL